MHFDQQAPKLIVVLLTGVGDFSFDTQLARITEFNKTFML
jgi:hypothetical protein